jgi:Dolichyl-phosphate-mannose-protein mannosyltransferase
VIGDEIGEQVSKTSTKSRTSKNGTRADQGSSLPASKNGKEAAHVPSQSRAGEASPTSREEGIEDTGPSLYSQLTLLIKSKDRVPQLTRTYLEQTRTYLEQKTPENLRQGRWLDHRVVLMVLAVKGVLILFAGQSYQVFENKTIPTLYGWLEIWNRWDSLRHLRLAESGYTSVGEWRMDIVGFPLYPWLVRLCAFVVQDYLVSAFVVSGVASVAAALLLYRLAALDHSDQLALASVWFLLIFPTSYLLHINYNESLFLALTIGCFLAARMGYWPLVGILGASACLTRMNGLVIVPALTVEVFQQYRATRRWQWHWLWILIVPVGFGCYLLLNQQVTGDMFAFITAGKEFFHKSFATPWAGVSGTFNMMWSDPPTNGQMLGVQEFVFLMLGAVGTIVCWIVLRPAYAMWMTGNWLLYTSIGFVLGVPRYTLVLFPIYLLFAKLAVSRLWVKLLITTWSLLYLALFTSLFVRGHWAGS